MKSKILKAEILLTRHCNCKCEYCNIVDNMRQDELTVEQWKKAFDNIINVLGAKFIAIYGGEPMVKYPMLLELVRYLSETYPDVDYTVISNSILLNEQKAEELVAAGLKSWTVSCDSVDEGDTRDNAGLKALAMFKELGVPDLAISITIHAKNLDKVPDVVRYATERGYWSLFDIIHTDKGGYSFAPPKERIPDYVLDMSHAPKLQQLAFTLSKMYYEENAKIHQLPEFFNYVANPFYSIERNWMCKYPAWITVDSNGHMMCCEDWIKDDTYDFNILDFVDDEIWDAYLQDWWTDTRKCKGCLWSGHLLSELALKDENGADYFAHRRRNI